MKLSKAKYLGGIALSMLCLSVTNSYAAGPPFITQTPLFSPYNIDAAPNGYILKGTLYANPPSGPITGPGTLVIDPQNKRIAFRFETAGLGSFVTLPQGTYNFNLPGTNGACFIYPGFNFDVFKRRFQALSSTPGSTNLLSRYTGYVYDSSSCNQPASSTFIHAPMDIKGTQGILEMEFAIPTPSGSVCRQGQAYWTGDPSSMDTKSSTSVRDQYFDLPASCNNPIPWCEAVYYNTFAPPGTPPNACAVQHSTPLPLSL